MPLGEGIQRVPKSWGMPGKSCNTLPILTEGEAKRTAEVLGKVEPGGYFDVSKVLGSKTFKKHFARGRMEVSSSGRENTTSGDEAMSSQISLSTLTKERNILGRTTTPKRKAEVDDSKGKEAMPPPPPTKRTKSNKGVSNAIMRTLAPGTSSPLPGDNLGFGASMMLSAPVARKILNGIILPVDKEKLEQFTSDNLVTKSFHALGQAAMVGAELKDKSKVVVRLEAEVAEFTSKLVQAKKLAIKEFKSSNDFKLLHQHPNLGIDMASMEMDVDFDEEEEAAKEGEKEMGNEGEANPTP
ncbi:hypothetical protein Acr_00g0086530 [Actinidia rufa]|uniref:Uncharacterized protein n=1 Tax=Actinidia rufa TaxID=165716 RepID=A0A7J0DW19_9ERIC|nr:hypothetical protein Acr_00g0086530 [Actinidia rufa]